MSTSTYSYYSSVGEEITAYQSTAAVCRQNAVNTDQWRCRWSEL